jgi:putative spermidine/putrescine transport system permease protein
MKTGVRWGLVAALLVAGPVLVGVAYSTLGTLDLAGPGASGNPTLERWVRIVGDRRVWRGTAWTIWVAGASTLLSAAGAVLLAVTFRSRSPVDRVARTLAILPLPIPHVVAGVTGVLILGQSGLLARILHAVGMIETPAEMPALVYDPAGLGLIATLVWKEIPFLALVAFSVLAAHGEEMEETARTLGAGAWATFRRVTFPLLWRGMLPAVVAVFAFVAGSYELAILLAPSDPLALPLQTMERYTHSSLTLRADAFVLVLLGLAIAATAVALHEVLSMHEPGAER